MLINSFAVTGDIYLHSASFKPDQPAQALVRRTLCFLQELYHECHALDRFEQDYRRKVQEDDTSNATQRGIPYQ